MDLISLIVFLLAFILCYVFLRRSKTHLPGPTGIPFVGRPLFLRSSTKRRYEVAMEASKEYGDIFSFKQGRINIVLVQGYDNINDLFVKRSEEFSDRPSWLPTLKKNLADGIGITNACTHTYLPTYLPVCLSI